MTRPPVDRRQGPDLWSKLLTAAGLLSGASLVVALFITAVAKPEVETYFDRFYDLPLRRTWDLELMQYLLYSLLLCLFSSSAGLIINHNRKRRKDGRTRISLFVMLGLSILGIVQYLLFMSRYP